MRSASRTCPASPRSRGRSGALLVQFAGPRLVDAPGMASEPSSGHAPRVLRHSASITRSHALAALDLPDEEAGDLVQLDVSRL